MVTGLITRLDWTGSGQDRPALTSHPPVCIWSSPISPALPQAANPPWPTARVTKNRTHPRVVGPSSPFLSSAYFVLLGQVCKTNCRSITTEFRFPFLGRVGCRRASLSSSRQPRGRVVPSSEPSISLFILSPPRTLSLLNREGRTRSVLSRTAHWTKLTAKTTSERT